MPSSCYGSYSYNKRPECPTCECYAFCRDAREPEIRAIEYNDEIGGQLLDPVYPDDTPPVEDEHESFNSEIIHYLGVIFGEMIRAVRADPVDFLIIASRMYGLSYDAIGKHCSMTKQAISKRCQNIGARSPAINHFLKKQLCPNTEIVELYASTTFDLRQNDGNRRKKSPSE